MRTSCCAYVTVTQFFWCDLFKHEGCTTWKSTGERAKLYYRKAQSKEITIGLLVKFNDHLVRCFAREYITNAEDLPREYKGLFASL